MKTTLTIIETESEWLLSFDGHNPSKELSFAMPKDEAFRLKDLLAPLFPYGTENLLGLQKALRDKLFVRPYDLHDIEKAGINLCDGIIDALTPFNPNK